MYSVIEHGEVMCVECTNTVFRAAAYPQPAGYVCYECLESTSPRLLEAIRIPRFSHKRRNAELED